MHKLVKKMFVKQPLALPGSANYVIQAKDILNCKVQQNAIMQSATLI